MQLCNECNNGYEVMVMISDNSFQLISLSFFHSFSLFLLFFNFFSAQISLNLTDMDLTPMHIAYEEAKKDAEQLSIPVTGSEVVGLVPLKALLGKYCIDMSIILLYCAFMIALCFFFLYQHNIIQIALKRK